MDSNTILIIQGPTGSGKTNLAYRLAKKMGAEIVSADSRQIYKHANVGTGKVIFPDIKTYLIDIIDPDVKYNAYMYKIDAERKIKELLSKNIPILIVGGTNFYIDILTGKLILNEEDPAFLDYLEKRRNELNTDNMVNLQSKLIKLNKEKFINLNNSEKNNRERLIKKIVNEEFRKQENKIKEVDYLLKDYNIKKFGILKSKEELKESIEKNVEDMFIDNKLIEELEYILTHFTNSSKILETIGYFEILDSVNYSKESKTEEIIQKLQVLSKEEIRVIKNKILSDTIHYAKRQMTWLKRDKDIKWIKGVEDIVSD